jgi:hypothetical protein
MEAIIRKESICAGVMVPTISGVNSGLGQNSATHKSLSKGCIMSAFSEAVRKKINYESKRHNDGKYF